jgi:large subunit ribosomal protein L19
MTNVDIVRKVQNEFLQTGRPDLRTGMEVEVYQIIRENGKERIQRFKGIIIKTAGKSELEKTITVRRKVGAFGVEKIFAIHSSTIEKIDVLRQFKVRRKSITFIRELTGKAARLKEIKMSKEELNAEKAIAPVTYAEQAESPVATKETPEAPETTAEETK